MSAALPVLLVDDEPAILHSTSIALRMAGIGQIVCVADSRDVLPLLARQAVGMVLLDLTMPHLSGQALLGQITADHPDLPVIVVTATNELETAVACMQRGAVDYLVKPVEPNRLVSSVRRAQELRELKSEVLSLKGQLLGEARHDRHAFAGIVTQDPAMFAIFRYLEAIAPSPQPVLITGETGTGKELVAQALHELSKRPGKIIAVNVAGLDDALFSDTLFGHAKGAYTGASAPREGLVAAAGEGTLFLDEIGDLAVASQVKLLRLLQDGAYYPLGIDRPRFSHARVIVATHCEVAQAVAAGTFRNDLYYRLRTHHLQLPPLRDRPGDLPSLVHHFVDKAAQALGKSPPAVPPALFQLLGTYPLPGNVRELESMVFDAVTRCRGTTLSLQSFKDVVGELPLVESGPDPSASLAAPRSDRLPTLAEAEETLIREALTRADGNQGVAAGMLGISRQALNKRLGRGGSRDPAVSH